MDPDALRARSLADLLTNGPAQRLARARFNRDLAYRLLAEADADEQAARDQQQADAELRADVESARRMTRRFGGGELQAFVERRTG